MIEYRYEAHESGDPRRHREIIAELGHDDWEFVAFVNHWGTHDGRTMLFKRDRHRGADIEALRTRVGVLERELLKAADALEHAYKDCQLMRAVRELVERPPPYRHDLYPDMIRDLVGGQPIAVVVESAPIPESRL